MKVFKIKISTAPETIGNYHQIQTFIPPFNGKDPNSYLRKLRNDEKAKEEVLFPIFKLEDDAIKTDILNCIPIGKKHPLISKKALDIFLKYNNKDFQFFSVKVSKDKEVFNYYALHFFKRRHNELIDWENSSFSLALKNRYHIEDGTMKSVLTERVNFNSHEKYLEKVKAIASTNMKVQVIKIRLTKNINQNIFRMGLPLNGLFCSEQFKNEIENNQLTGFKFEPLENEI